MELSWAVVLVRSCSFIILNKTRCFAFAHHIYCLNFGLLYWLLATPPHPLPIGISIHGQYRVATENTLFSMPETAIGLFPDVGSMFWMPRLLSKPIANYLALTGQRIRARDLCHFGMATHYILSKDLPHLEKALTEATSPLHATTTTTSTVESDREVVADILQSFHRPVKATEESILMNHQGEIERAFDADTIEDIVYNLKRWWRL